MKYARQFLLSICILLFAGFISDGQGISFFAAAMGLCLADWVMRAGNSAADKRFLMLDPDTLDTEPLRKALNHILNEVRRIQRPIQLRLAPLTQKLRFRPQLQLNREGEIEIIGCNKKEIIEQPYIWIADHPLPLSLATQECSILTFIPSRGDRVRVELNTISPLSKRELIILGILMAITAALGFFNLFSAILAFTLYSSLLGRWHGFA
ncbi:MAG: hypothetical protein WCP12_02685 [bacterium]